MAVNIEKLRLEIRSDARKFYVSALFATVAILGAGVGIGKLIWAHQPPAAQP